MSRYRSWMPSLCSCHAFGALVPPLRGNWISSAPADAQLRWSRHRRCAIASRTFLSGAGNRRVPRLLRRSRDARARRRLPL